MRFPTMWYVQPAKARTSLRIGLNILWLLSYWLNIIGVSMPKSRLQRLGGAYTCQNATLLMFCQPRVTVTSCFVYIVIRDLESIDHLCINPIHRIGLVHKWSIDSRKLKWDVQVNVLLNNCKQNITSLSFLVGTIVEIKRELVALLCLFSWCLVIVLGLFFTMPRVCCSLWMWYFLIILTILVKSMYKKNKYLISQWKYMLWVLKRTDWMIQFFWASTTYVLVEK